MTISIELKGFRERHNPKYKYLDIWLDEFASAGWKDRVEIELDTGLGCSKITHFIDFEAANQAMLFKLTWLD